MKNRAVLTVVLSCLVAGMFAAGAAADDLGFFSSIFGSNPGMTIAGVPSGGAAWVINRGVATLNGEGRLRVDVRGLVLPVAGNTPGPVTAVAASVVCGDTVAATTDSVALSREGDAEIHAKVSIPSPCLGAVVLVRIAAFNGAPLPATGPFIAATGVAKDADEDRDRGEGHDN